jgi:hypothetical protein
VPADLREALGGAAPRHVPGLDFDELWRRHRRARSRRTMTGVGAALLTVLVIGSVIQWGPSLDLQPAGPQSFAGEWESVDLDGSSQQMTIRDSGDGTYQVEIFDDFSTACDGMSATASGTGTLTSDTRMTVTQVYRCEDGRELARVEGIRLDEWVLVYDPAADTITDPTDVVWFRLGAQVPALDELDELDELDTRTVETSLGTFSWTFVPHDAGASRLWNEAISRQPDRELGLAAGALPEAPAPQIAVMNWSEWWEERIARIGDVTIAAVSRHGEIDWSAVYALEPADDEWGVWGHWRHGPSGTTVELGPFMAPAFAVVEAILVPGDPGAVEFHDEESGELVLRLEATDPAVSAEHLFTQDPVVWSLLVDDGDGFRVVEPPWQRLPVRGIEVIAAPGGFVVVAAGAADASRPDQASQLYRWGSTDGVHWQALGAPLPLAVDGAEPRQLIGDDGRLLLQVVDRNERTTLWTSTDGADWQQVGPQLRGWTSLWRTSFGWALTAMDLRCETWLSADGVEWQRVPFHPEVENRRDVEAVQCSVLDDDVYVQLEEQAGDDFRPVGLWIGRLER